MSNSRKNIKKGQRSAPQPIKNNSSLLFDNAEMNRLLLIIADPEGKASSLLNKFTFRYKRLYYTLEQASVFLQITLKQLRALRAQGELPDKKIDGKTCIYAGDLRRFLRKVAARQSKNKQD
jgi:hypothetical protein